MKHKPGRSGHGPSTIHHVAERAGVSPMTVSRVINGKKNVKASTRARVEAAIRDLSYSPNPAATSLARDDLIRIGLLYGNPSAAYLSEFLVGGLEECSRRNVQLVVEQCEPGDENAVAEHLIESGIDGIILPPPLCDAASVIKVLAAAHTPAVAVAHRHNLDVPADLTVCGFDDTALATTIWPELTTIRQPVAEMSRAAVRLVIDEIRRRRAGDPEQHPHTLLDFALIRRQSDAAPRRRPPILRTEAAAGR